ncbi:GGDEF domain-containing protein [Pleionea sediminis]|uniref:GGDEF domain-containing protein n=1 Tax=Pleionea sediminis TaxID=2569479 RepID=UPI00118616D4|nr:GGDEF domain-containing protein [Pleionea sediminis]
MADNDEFPEAEEQLRRYLSRVSYTGMGIDSELNGKLEDLRDSIKRRESVELLGKNVEAITQCLHDIEERYQTRKAEADPKSALMMLSNQLIDSVNDRKIRKRLKKLTNTQSSLNVSECVEQLKAIILSMSQAPEKRSWLSNLFSSNKPSPSPEKVEEHDQLDEGQTGSQKKQGIPDTVSSALHNFIEQLGHIEIYQEATATIKEQLSNLSEVEDLAPLIEEIAAVLLQAANTDHSQFENFLNQLNKRLLKVASYLNQASINNDEFFEDTKRLDNELKKTIDEIKREISDSTGLGPLKHRLIASFEHIFNSVSRFKEAQVNHVKTSQDELKIIKEQLKLTEDETERLTKTLQEQREKAYSDPLTKLPNRYAYNERVAQEYARWKRYKTPLSMAVIDIDFFKKVNDQYGHHNGDIVLQQVAQSLSQGMREADFIARFGGEEFVILMIETNLNDATKATNKLRQLVANQSISLEDDTTINVTISCGVAEFEGVNDESEVFAKADKALYRAKEKGRNQVCCERNKKHQS